jgi:hypothetical protein
LAKNKIFIEKLVRRLIEMAKNLKANFVFWVVLMMIIFLEGISGLTGKNSENQGKKEIIVLPGTSSSVLPFSSAVKAGNFMFFRASLGPT